VSATSSPKNAPSIPKSFRRSSSPAAPGPKCDAIAAEIEQLYNVTVRTAEVDADSVPQLVVLLNAIKPQLVINVALPYQDLAIMDACLECGVNYLDTANYEPPDSAHSSTAGSGPTRTNSGTRA